jgi:stage II sporulation protein R
MDRKFKIFEISLLIGLVCAIVIGASAQRAQKELSDKLLRLHVAANSDTEIDQELKLSVRDRILEFSEPLIGEAKSLHEAADVLTLNLPYIIELARDEVTAMGYDYAVSAELKNERFPTREYDGFSLPAGTYHALRVTIGDGDGQNWWCVVFPPLCGQYGNYSEVAKQAGLSDDEIALIADSDGVKIKFRLIEIFEKMRSFLGA